MGRKSPGLWEKREMVSRGLVFARRKSNTRPGKGHFLYKAENILAGELYGDPQDVDVDISSARNMYLFRFLDILPERMFAVSQIVTCPNAARPSQKDYQLPLAYGSI